MNTHKELPLSFPGCPPSPDALTPFYTILVTLPNPLDEKVRKLERQNARLENELRKAHLIIDVQGKVAGLLGISFEDGTNS